MQDEKILDLYWERNESAIYETEQKYGRYLTKIAYNILADMEDSKESVNDTYLGAWNSMPPHKPEILSTYLVKITRRISIDIFRKRNRKKRQISEYTISLEELGDCVSVGDTTEQEVDALRMEKQFRIKKTERNWKKWGTLVAGICLLIVGVKMWTSLTESDKLFETMESEGTATTETMADMIAFFIYQGNMYEQYEIVDEPELVGAYVGTATGQIDEWSKEEDYVESAGSVHGDFYEVNGFSPEFMLCMKQDDGSVSTYINADGLVLEKGAELFEDYLHLAGNYQEVQYQTRDEWYYGTGEPKTIPEEYAEEVTRFVGALDDGEIIAAVSYPVKEGEEDIYAAEIYHMYFQMENGMQIHLRIFKNGYVAFAGAPEQLVQVEEPAFEEMIQVLEEVR